MNSLKQKIQQHYSSANIAEQFMYLNIAIFIITISLGALTTLMHWGENPFFEWFALPSIFESFIVKPWTIISYGFSHKGFLHILLNSVLLFYFGNLFLDFFSKRDFLSYYFLGIIVGGIAFLTSYNFFPALIHQNNSLVGASAGVTAILIGIATKIPNYALQLRFIGALKLWYIAIGFILWFIIQLSAGINTGGNLAHLGGALTGFLLTTQTDKGKNFSSFLGNLFKSRKQSPLKTVYKKANPVSNTKSSNGHQRKVDAILDKISKSGYETLNQEEKDFLFSIGKK